MKRTPLTRRAPIARTTAPLPGKAKPARQPKPIKCEAPGCTVVIEHRRSLDHKACSPRCAEAAIEARKLKRQRKAQQLERAQDKERLEALKSLTKLADEAQAEVNRYVRLRDHDLPCISCGKPATAGGVWNASHFRSRGAASSIRFNLWNNHKACVQCNKEKGGNLAEYTPRLVAKIGQAKVDWLYTQNNVNRYSREQLVRIRKVFKRKADRLAKRIRSAQ
jgi:hypothetical protein